jgi:hypothetical protein
MSKRIYFQHDFYENAIKGLLWYLRELMKPYANTLTDKNFFIGMKNTGDEKFLFDQIDSKHLYDSIPRWELDFLGAYDVTLVYFIAIFIAIINLPLVPVLHSKGLAKQAFWNQLWATVSYCIVIYPLALYFLAIGAALAYIAFYIVWMFLALKTIKNNKVFV